MNAKRLNDEKNHRVTSDLPTQQAEHLPTQQVEQPSNLRRRQHICSRK